MGSADVTPSKRAKSPSLAAFLSFIWPGLGQAYLRRRKTALFFAAPMLVALAIAVNELLPGSAALALSMVSSGYALAVVAALAGCGIWRAVAVIHAAVSASGTRLTRRTNATLAVLLVAILAMHALPSYYAWSAYQADVDFVQPMPSIAYSTPDPSEAPVLTTPSPGEFTPEPQPAILTPRRETVLITGLDFGPGRTHSLTDTMMVVSLDLEAKQVAMVSVPRDTTMFRLYWNGGTLGPTFKLNALVTAVANHWIDSPDDAMTTLKNELGYILGIPVNYYAAIDLNGFPRMVDLAGGVDVYNPKTFWDPAEQRQWNQGLLHLNGADALLYVRSRKGDNDYYRAERQQDVMVALEKKLTTPEMLLRLPDFLALAGKAIRTDYPLDRLRDRGMLARGIPSNAIHKCVLGPPYSWHPDSSTTRGVWTSRLDMNRVAALSVYLFGEDSAYSGKAAAAACAS